MARLVRFPMQRLVREQAYEWIICLEEGLSDTERSQLDHWIREAPKRRRILIEAAEHWDNAQILSELADVFPLVAGSLRIDQRVHHKRLGVAAAVAGVGILSWWALSGLPDAETNRTNLYTSVARYETDVGQQQTVSLADGSIVTMNTNTVVSVEYGATERSVALLQGEATFDVESNPARPFRVYAGAREFEAIGTRFNIDLSAGDRIELMVSEGSVRVAQVDDANIADRSEQNAASESASTQLTVQTGQLAVISDFSQSITWIAAPDLEAELAWQQGMLLFRGDPLRDALSEMSRYTHIQMQLSDESLGNIRVGGYFRAGDTDALLLALEQSFGIESRVAAENILILEQNSPTVE